MRQCHDLGAAVCQQVDNGLLEIERLENAYRRRQSGLLNRAQRIRVDLSELLRGLLDFGDYRLCHGIELDITYTGNNLIHLIGDAVGLRNQIIDHRLQGCKGCVKLRLQIGNRDLVQGGIQLAEDIFNKGSDCTQVNGIDAGFNGVEGRVQRIQNCLPDIAAHVGNFLVDRVEDPLYLGANAYQIQLLNEASNVLEKTKNG